MKIVQEIHAHISIAQQKTSVHIVEVYMYQYDCDVHVVCCMLVVLCRDAYLAPITGAPFHAVNIV